jgi:hypothetical protein
VQSSSILRYFLASVALLGACVSGLLGVASYLFHRGDRVSVAIAARLVPFNPAYLARLSGYESGRRTELLRKAAALNPYSEQVWLQLGFDSEFYHGDLASAEKYYLHSTEVSSLFLPRWTLANFYFRRQNKPEFMKWARAALEITPYRADPIFTEMWLVYPDHSRIVADLPSRAPILEQYLMFLMNARQLGSVPPVVERLASSASPSDSRRYGVDDVIGPALDSLIAGGYVSEAVRSWNALSVAHWIPFGTPTVQQPLTDGSFGPMYGYGFDWKLINIPGISFSRGGGVGIELSGGQPESCELLQQWVLIGPDRQYRLQWNADASGITDPAGLNWHIQARDLDSRSPDLLAEHRSGWQFETPANAQAALLTLEYRRPLGHIRASGALQLRSVTLQPR